MVDKYFDCCLEVGDNIRPHIQQGQTGKKYLYFRITKKKNGPDQYGKTHNLSIHYKDETGRFQTIFIGSATEKEFQVQQAPAPAPQGGYAPQGQYNQQRQYQQAPPQGYAPQAPAQPQYAPQAPAPAPAPQNYAPQPQNFPPQAPPPTMADAPFETPSEDLPF